MPAAATLALKILASPIWLLWRLYLVLWWAFNEEPAAPRSPREGSARSTDPLRDDAPKSVPTANDAVRAEAFSFPGPRTQRVAQEASFEIIDSTPSPAPKPLGALKGGFAASLLLSALFAWLVNYAAGHDIVRPSSQLPLWLWSSCIAFVGTLWPVRHIARRQSAAQPANWRDHTVCVAGGLKDAGVGAFNTARTAKDVSVSAGRRVYSAATRVGEGARRLWDRAPRKTA